MKFLILLLGAFVLSCSNLSKKETKAAEYYFNRALKYKKSGSANLALENLSKIRKDFFDSPYNQKALLMTADVYFDDNKLEQAIQSYKKYQKFYPESKKDYVLYHIAVAYKKQLPRWAENDLSLADSALSILQPLLSSSGPFQEKALKLQEELLNKKAKKELQVILFYKNQKKYSASFQRVKEWIQNYPKSFYQPKALLIAFQLASQLHENPSPFKQKLLEDYPQSKEAGQLKKTSLFQNFKNRIFL